MNSMENHKPHALVGKRIKYRYEGGWEYHVHYESETKISYDVVSGPFGSRKASQTTFSKEIAPNVVMVGWYEETGTIVVQTVNLNTLTLTSFAGFPRWLFDNPGLSHGKKEDNAGKIQALRSTLPDAPREVFFESAKIFSVE
jgi:phenolic acid decarboxylase